MECIQSGNRRAYLNEYAEINVRPNHYRNNLQKGIGHILVPNLIMSIVFGNLLVLNVIVAIFHATNWVDACFCLAISTTYFCKLIADKRNINYYKMNESDRKVTIDESGIRMDWGTSASVLYWESIKSIRAYKYSLYFAPKSSNDPCVVIPIENLSYLKQFLSSSNHQIKIIEI